MTNPQKLAQVQTVAEKGDGIAAIQGWSPRTNYVTLLVCKTGMGIPTMGISCGVQVRKLHPTVMSDNAPNPIWGRVTGRGESRVQQPGPRVQGLCGRGVLGSGRGARGRRAPSQGACRPRGEASAKYGSWWAGSALHSPSLPRAHMQEQLQKVSRASIICSPVKSLSLMLSSFLWPLEKVHPLKNGNSATKFMYSLPLGKRYSKPWKISRPNPKQSPQREQTFSLIPWHT